jgi:hypothetical protein
MRNAILVSILTVVLVVSAAAVWAGPPLNGTWKSTNSDFDEGTATTKWAPVTITWASGNVIYGQSYNGGFTNDWTINCPTVSRSSRSARRSERTGNFTYMITYTGGYVTLGGPGNPWNGGDAVYTGTIDSYVEIRTIQTASNLIVGAVSDHNVSAHIQGYTESCVAWAIGNGVLRGGTSPSLPKAFNYGVLQSVKPGAIRTIRVPAACSRQRSGPLGRHPRSDPVDHGLCGGHPAQHVGQRQGRCTGSKRPNT